MSLNRAQLIGNLTRDPEMKQIPGGQAVTTFSLATNLSWTDASGQKQDKAEYHNIVAWRKLAEICGQYLKKGTKVFIEGRIQTRAWEAEDGAKKYRTEIVAENMIMLDRKGEGIPMDQSGHAGLNQSTSQQVPTQMAGNAPAYAEEEVTIDDLPF
ncbi:single-stranded DNA-binding protein [bacterium]|nr:single-stranded DNA-binding protein [bacterium]